MKMALDARKIRCQEVHDLTSRLCGLSAVGVSLRPKQCDGTLSTIALDDVSIQVLRSAPMLMLADSSPDRTTLLKAMDGTERARWNGDRLASSRIIVCDSSRQHDAIYPDDFACLLLSFGGPTNDQIANRAANEEMQGGVAGGGNASDAALRELDRVSCAVEDTLAETPDLLMDEEAARGLRASILDAAGAILMPSEALTRRSARSAWARRRLVHAADDYLRANPARPVYTEELCTALGAAATRLHQAFHATFGMSPHRYLKLRRMGMVRAMLLSRSGPWHSVKAAALSHGFWHLGQFAHDYRDLYGELPSETLARGRAIMEAPADFDMDEA
jgi:AraC family transcriptional regulator, ethanolamine operon transcriptional activator